MGRPGNCCGFNLAKLDPTTGAIIWTKLVPGGGVTLTEKAPVVEVEPLRGTNDVLVSIPCALTVPRTTAPINAVTRVSSVDGSTVWNNTCSSAYASVCPQGALYSSVRGLFGADGAHIAVAAYSAAGTTMYGLNYDGTTAWTNTTPAATGMDFVFTTASAVITAHIDGYGYWNVDNWNQATGVLNNSTQLVGTSYPLVSTFPYCANYLNGDIYARAYLSGTVPLAVLAPSSYSASSHNTTAGAPDSSAACLFGSNLLLGPATTAEGLWDCSSSLISHRWTKATLFNPTTSPNAFCADSTGGYFTGLPYATNGYLNVYKRELSNGEFLWGQDLTFNGKATAVAYTCCIADDGYLYIGGNPT